MGTASQMGGGPVTFMEHPRENTLFPFGAKLQQLIWLHFQNRRNVEKELQGEAPIHIGRFDGGHMLTADSQFLSQLLL